MNPSTPTERMKLHLHVIIIYQKEEKKHVYQKVNEWKNREDTELVEMQPTILPHENRDRDKKSC